jgi:hypothetical protein
MSIEKILFLCDAPELTQLGLQDPSTTTMEVLLQLNRRVWFVLTVIAVLVAWTLSNLAPPLRLHKPLFFQNFSCSVRVTTFLQGDVELLVERNFALESCVKLFSVEQVAISNNVVFDRVCQI